MGKITACLVSSLTRLDSTEIQYNSEETSRTVFVPLMVSVVEKRFGHTALSFSQPNLTK